MVRSRILVSTFFAILLVAGGTPLLGQAARDGVFIHLSHGPSQAHRVLMALKTAEMMCDGHDLPVYMDIDAVHVALDSVPEAMIRSILKKEGTVMVCPTCPYLAGKSSGDPIQGVRLADRDAFFSFTKGRPVTPTIEAVGALC